MKKNNVIIISIIIVAFTIGLVYIIFNNLNASKEKDDIQYNINQSEINDNKYKVIDDESIYFTIKNCLKKYEEIVKTENGKAILDLINKKYIQENNITEKNMFNYIDNISENLEIYIKKILTLGIEDDKQYYVYAELRDKNDYEKDRKKVYLIVELDLDDMTFSVMPNVSSKEVFNEY